MSLYWTEEQLEAFRRKREGAKHATNGGNPRTPKEKRGSPYGGTTGGNPRTHKEKRGSPDGGTTGENPRTPEEGKGSPNGAPCACARKADGQGEGVAAQGQEGADLRVYGDAAVSVPMNGWTGKQTATEKRYNRERLGGAGRFEAMAFRLPGGGRYTPDFMTLDGGVATFHEVKGTYRLGSQGRAWTAFCEAAAAFPCFRWIWAELKKDGWRVKRFYPAAIGDDGMN